MKHRRAYRGRLIVLPLVMLAVVGCTATRQVKKGDEALERGRHGEALRHFQKAAAARPRLHQDPRFESKFNLARSRVTYEQAQQLMRQRAYEQAVSRLEESVEADAGFAPAQRALTQAKHDASRQLYERALASADQGRRDAAAEQLERAVGFDANNGAARRALDSLISSRSIEGDGAPGAYEQGVALREEKHWQQVLQALNRAVAADPDHIPSRLARHEALEALKRSRSLNDRASAQLEARRLEDAIESASSSLEIWPANQGAQRVLGEAKAARERSRDLLNEGRGLAGRKSWDEAVTALRSALAIYPFDQEAATFLDRTRTAAAADHTARGQSLLKAGRLDDAEAAFRDALRFVKEDKAARGGLGETHLARGHRAEARGLPGSALLWYLDAQDMVASKTVRGAVAGARAELYRRSMVGLGLSVSGQGGWTGEVVDGLRRRLAARAQEMAPPFVRVYGEGDEVDEVAYTASLAVTDVKIDQRRIRSDQRTQTYFVDVSEPNPSIPRLRSELYRAEARLAQLQQRYHEPCHVCHGQRRVRCEHCHGRGTIPCSACGGRGFISFNGERRGCSTCGGRGHVRCSHCRGGYETCSRCRGTGRHYPDITRHDVDRASRRVRELRHQLDCAPAYVIRRYTRKWPYTVELHEKTGDMSARAHLWDVRSQSDLGDDRLTAEFAKRDERILNANAEIGLPRDELDLPLDSEVLDALTEQMAERVVVWIYQRVVRTEVARQIARGQTHADAGEDAAAVEANVAAAVLMETTDREQAKRLWATLRQR